MDTTNFCTRQETGTISLPKGKDYIISIDIGYSGVKSFFETGYHCFPSYVKKISDQTILIPDRDDIFYRDDETGDVYLVGINALQMTDEEDKNETEKELFSRKRYTSASFRVICDTAIGLALSQKKDDRNLVIQTGLPADYMKDAEILKSVLFGQHAFSLKAGHNDSWRSFTPNIAKENVFVMPQPKGALYSAIIKNDGSLTPNAMDVLKGSVMVCDIGFLTLDLYGIRDRKVDIRVSVDNLGMHEVFLRTAAKIEQQFGEEVRVQALQSLLPTGKIVCFDEASMTSEEKDFSPFLEASNREVFEEAKEKIRLATDSLRHYRSLIVDGGTGEAWFTWIADWLKNMKTLSVLPSNTNDKLPFLYSNARGYYLYRYSSER